MPINIVLMNSLIKKYGPKKGKSIYFGMENEGKAGFQKGVKTASKQGKTVAHLKDLKSGKSGQMVKKVKSKVSLADSLGSQGPQDAQGPAYMEAMANNKAMAGIRADISKRMGIKKNPKKVKRVVKK